MKLISLNTWGARAGLEKLLAFVRAHEDTDIFCFQEVWNGGEHMLGQKAGGSPLIGTCTTLLQQIEQALPSHKVFFKPHFFDFYGLAILAKKNIEILAEGEVFIYKERGYISEDELGNHARNLQYLTFATAKGKRTVANIHGLWNGQGKSDSVDRLQQSENILAFFASMDHPYILSGDFNLRPDTESIKMLERAGLRNLIREYGISSTRTSLYIKLEKFADYILTSPDIIVNDFRVLPEEVSDHAPLMLDFG